MSQTSLFERIRTNPWVAPIISFIGAFVYLVQAWNFAHNQASVLDEGLYLFKGLLFARGQYFPFQDYDQKMRW